MSTASEGLWIWDAVDSSYFVFQASICMVLGDMLGSAKLNGMAGHLAICRDCFSLVKGACATLQKGKAQYYPISPPNNAKKEYNPTWPTYSFENLPIQTQSQYWDTIKMLSNAKTKKDQIVRATGVVHLLLCTANLAFIHPTFHPMDPFHLLYKNCMAFLWDLWNQSKPTDLFYIPQS
jgi:hypothetical protein